jgi:mannose-6-phosphate isomerase-like protein (cupin superfamily)
MNRRGQVFENPVTGERVVVLTDPDDHPERVLVAHLFVRPGGRVAAEHFHPTLTERFYVVSGQVGFLIDGHERVLGAGEGAEVAPGVRHDWWQIGPDEAQVVVEVDPGDRFVEMVGTLFGLARDGKVGSRRLPGPLQLAVTARAYRDVMVIASPPEPVQRVVFGVLGPLGRALGRRPTYPEYLSSADTVEPDPTALALLTPEGRLRPVIGA